MPKATRKVYHVTAGSIAGWDVKAEGNKRLSGRFPKKSDAVARGKELAKKAALGQLVVHKADGKIQTEHTYGADQLKSKG